MKIRKLTREAFERRPYEAWNAFINLISTEQYTDLNAVQRIAQLCFRYDSEVQNGGHLQYFENVGIALLNQTISALGALGADCQKRVLQHASRLFLSKSRSRIETREVYIRSSLVGEF